MIYRSATIKAAVRRLQAAMRTRKVLAAKLPLNIEVGHWRGYEYRGMIKKTLLRAGSSYPVEPIKVSFAIDDGGYRIQRSDFFNAYWGRGEDKAAIAFPTLSKGRAEFVVSTRVEDGVLVINGTPLLTYPKAF